MYIGNIEKILFNHFHKQYQPEIINIIFNYKDDYILEQYKHKVILIKDKNKNSENIYWNYTIDKRMKRIGCLLIRRRTGYFRIGFSFGKYNGKNLHNCMFKLHDRIRYDIIK